MSDAPRSKRSLLYKYYLFLRDFFRDLFEDKVGYYASSLSWSTLFSIIPLLVLILYIFTTLPLFDTVYENVRQLIFANLMPTQSAEIMAKLNEFIANSNKLGWIGFFYVTFAVVVFLKNYDYVVNDIFELPPRNLLESIKTYLLLMLLLPSMMGGAFWLSSFIQSYLDRTEFTQFIHLYYFLPYLIIWGVFYIAYQISAQTPIQPKAAVASSFIASLIWYGSKSAFVFYVVHNKTYLTIYGSISTILFFFLWIYISWAIFLHGLRFCYLLDKEVDFDQI